MHISIVVPVYNERENIRPLWKAISATMSPLGAVYELIFVNDGSRDGSAAELDCIAAEDSRVKLVHFGRNFGQTAALSAGIDMAAGDVIATLDGDLQNDPADIPLLLAKLNEGYDVVHGWRADRQDAPSRTIPSRMANWLIRRVTGVKTHDLGCTLRVMRAAVARELPLHGELHRFIPVFAHWQGARATEVPTRHHARKFGSTKYGLGRTLRVAVDLLTVNFMVRHAASPMKFFARIGLACAAVSVACASIAGTGMLLGGWRSISFVLLMFSGFSAMAALQSTLLGFIAETSAGISNAQGKRPYHVRRLVNFEQCSQPTLYDPGRHAA